MSFRPSRLVLVASGLLMILGAATLGLRMAGAGADSVLNLTRLPGTLEKGMIFVLLLPLGGLITSIIRLGFNLRVFGYFTAPLLGMSFMYAPWTSGLVTFGVMTAIGLFGMVLANRLGLAKLPRLSLLMCALSLTLVIMLSTMHDMDVEVTRTGVMLPMVTMTMMIEAFHRTIERDGMRRAYARLGGTLLAAGATLAVFRLHAVQHAFLTHPELLFFVAAGLVVTGRLTMEVEARQEAEEAAEAEEDALSREAPGQRGPSVG